MGVVYKARQKSLDRWVALKFLPAERAYDPLWLGCLRREACTASALNHPHICTIYDTGECDGRPFLSMELIAGRTLEPVAGQRTPVEEVVNLIGQAARAVAAAPAAGVVHRDIKPANRMVRDDGIVKVLDFGLARRLPAAGGAGPATGTDPGTRVGTLLYMSPEQARAEPAGTASDIFALGIVLYELAAEVACREAEACFRRALTIARGQQAKSLELRAVMSLTRLYRQQGRQAEARPLLAETYGWFTEGFDSPDLQEAKALLEQLS